MVSLFSGSLDGFLPPFGPRSLARILQIPSIMSGLLVRECEALPGGNFSAGISSKGHLSCWRLG